MVSIELMKFSEFWQTGAGWRAVPRCRAVIRASTSVVQGCGIRRMSTASGHRELRHTAYAYYHAQAPTNLCRHFLHANFRLSADALI